MLAAVQTMAVEAAVQAALEGQKQHLARLYERKLAAELSDKWPSEDAAVQDEKFSTATVLFVDVLNYASLAEKLSNSELSDVVRQFYNNAGDTVYLFGARHMQFIGDGLLVVFVDSADTTSVNHGLRASRAALGLVDSARRVQQFLNSQFSSRGLPRFEISIALNSGPVALARLEDPLHGGVQILPVGDTVSATLLLQKQARKAGWQITTSVYMLRGVTGAVHTGGRALITLPGRSSPMDAAELLGLALE